MTLSNLSNLVAEDSGRHEQAEMFYAEALTVYRQLAKYNPGVYQPYVAMTLNNLALLVAKDSGRHEQTETIYAEVLTIRRQLAKDNSAVYQPALARTLAEIGVYKFQWSKTKQGKAYLIEAANILKPFAEQSPEVHSGLYSWLIKQITE